MAFDGLGVSCSWRGSTVDGRGAIRCARDAKDPRGECRAPCTRDHRPRDVLPPAIAGRRPASEFI